MAEHAEHTRPPGRSARRRVLVWLAWWVLMMAFWVMVDDSIQFDELLAGAGAAALAALAAELATYQASLRLRPSDARSGSSASKAHLAAEILRLPSQVAKDTATVFAVLARTLATGRPPDGGFTEVPVQIPPGEPARVLLTGLRSVAPNTFVVDIDPTRDIMLVHHLTTPGKAR